MNGNFLNNKKLLALVFLTILAYITGFMGYLSTVESSSRDRFFMHNKGGDVLFEHDEHQQKAGNCSACHHEILSADERADCNDCHDDMEADYFTHADLKQVDSHQCITCHRIDETKEPQNCRVCHTINHDEPGHVDCLTCHDDPDYNMEFFGHDELCEIDGHDCAGCHSAQSTEGIYHQQCNDCHRLENESYFFEPDGGVRCQACHLK
ncbi:MAG: cytochrome c3 family protein [Calditrichaceae bacterium]